MLSVRRRRRNVSASTSARPTSEQREQQPLRRRRRPLEEAVRLLEDREAERVRVELPVHVERRADDEVEAVRGRGGERDEVHAPPLEHERGADEEERRDVDEVPLLDARLEDRREVRGLHRGVEAEADEPGERRRSGTMRSSRVRSSPRAGTRPASPTTSGIDADPDRERAGRPVAEMKIGASSSCTR